MSSLFDELIFVQSGPFPFQRFALNTSLYIKGPEASGVLPLHAMSLFLGGDFQTAIHPGMYSQRLSCFLPHEEAGLILSGHPQGKAAFIILSLEKGLPVFRMGKGNLEAVLEEPVKSWSITDIIQAIKAAKMGLTAPMGPQDYLHRFYGKAPKSRSPKFSSWLPTDHPQFLRQWLSQIFTSEDMTSTRLTTLLLAGQDVLEPRLNIQPLRQALQPILQDRRDLHQLQRMLASMPHINSLEKSFLQAQQNYQTYREKLIQAWADGQTAIAHLKVTITEASQSAKQQDIAAHPHYRLGRLESQLEITQKLRTRYQHLTLESPGLQHPISSLPVDLLSWKEWEAMESLDQEIEKLHQDFIQASQQLLLPAQNPSSPSDASQQSEADAEQLLSIEKEIVKIEMRQQLNQQRLKDASHTLEKEQEEKMSLLQTRSKELDQLIRKRKEVLTQVNASFLHWLEQHYPDWQETVGKVVKEEILLQPVFGAEIEKLSPLLFGIRLELSDFDTKLPDLEHWQEELDLWEKEAEKIRQEIAQFQHYAHQAQVKLTKRYQQRGKEMNRKLQELKQAAEQWRIQLKQKKLRQTREVQQQQQALAQQSIKELYRVQAIQQEILQLSQKRQELWQKFKTACHELPPPASKKGSKDQFLHEHYAQDFQAFFVHEASWLAERNALLQQPEVSANHHPSVEKLEQELKAWEAGLALLKPLQSTGHLPSAPIPSSGQEDTSPKHLQERIRFFKLAIRQQQTAADQLLQKLNLLTGLLSPANALGLPLEVSTPESGLVVLQKLRTLQEKGLEETYGVLTRKRSQESMGTIISSLQPLLQAVPKLNQWIALQTGSLSHLQFRSKAHQLWPLLEQIVNWYQQSHGSPHDQDLFQMDPSTKQEKGIWESLELLAEILTQFPQESLDWDLLVELTGPGLSTAMVMQSLYELMVSRILHPVQGLMLLFDLDQTGPGIDVSALHESCLQSGCYFMIGTYRWHAFPLEKVSFYHLYEQANQVQSLPLLTA
ncbi:MAG: hypothetical protein AAFR61_05080 [Bacteroidota bacterium]